MTSPMIYTTTYAQRSLDDVRRMLGDQGLLLDIRYSPWSRRPTWRRDVLKQALGDRYVWLKGFGNEAYREGRIELALPERALSKLRGLRRQRPGSPLYLMCACPRRRGCHRDTVARYIEQHTQDHVPEWTPQRRLL